MCGMKRYLRRVTKRNDRVFSHTINIPTELVRELGLSDAIVELKIKDDTCNKKSAITIVMVCA